MNEIIKYSKDDFLEGTAPFEDVYAYIDDRFELDRQIEKMSDAAKLVGVRNFKKMFGQYCKKMEMLSNQAYVDNASNFDGQEIDLNTGQWQADDYGITKEGPFGEICACVHPILPVQRLVNVDTGIEKLRIAYKKGKSWRNMIVERKQLASANSIVNLSEYGVAVTSENAKYLVQYFHDVENLNYEKIPENTAVTRMGWIGDEGFSPYVDGLVFDGNESFKHLFESVTQEGSAETWIEYVKGIREKGDVTARIALAASFASVLVDPCECLPFFVHMWGGSGSGKTVALMLAASVWANPSSGSYWHTFNSTSVGQELTAAFVNSMPLMLDEIQIIKERKDFDQMIYQLSEGVGRVRGSKQGGLQKVGTWKNCIMTTGEMPITSASSGAGAMNRIVEICCEDRKIFPDPKEATKMLSRNYGHAGKKFVDYLSEDNNMELARELQNSFFKTISESPVTEKQAMSASLILTADALIHDIFFEDGHGLKTNEVIPFLASNDDVSANLRARDWLLEWMSQNRNRFDESETNDNCWGAQRLTGMYVIRNVFNSACQDAGYNPTSFLTWLRNKGYIDTGPKGFTKSKRINGIPCNCVVLLDSFFGNEEVDE